MTVRPGTRFGSLIVLRSADRAERNCLCVCTRCQHSIVVATDALKDGSIASCDCCQQLSPSGRAARARGYRRAGGGRR